MNLQSGPATDKAGEFGVQTSVPETSICSWSSVSICISRPARRNQSPGHSLRWEAKPLVYRNALLLMHPISLFKLFSAQEKWGNKWGRAHHWSDSLPCAGNILRDLSISMGSQKCNQYDTYSYVTLGCILSTFYLFVNNSKKYIFLTRLMQEGLFLITSHLSQGFKLAWRL